MSKRLFLGFLFVLVILPFTASAIDLPAKVCENGIDNTAVAVPGVNVEVFGGSGFADLLFVGVSDGEGGCMLDNVPLGEEVMVKMTKDGYVPQYDVRRYSEKDVSDGLILWIGSKANIAGLYNGLGEVLDMGKGQGYLDIENEATGEGIEGVQLSASSGKVMDLGHGEYLISNAEGPSLNVGIQKPGYAFAVESVAMPLLPGAMTQYYVGLARPDVSLDLSLGLTGTFGSPVTFATHAELASNGFAWGPSDGTFGAIPAGGGTYTFYGTGGSGSACAGTPNVSGAFTFNGTLDQVTGSSCRRLFGPGDGPAGWIFDRDYAGGGQVVRFSSGGKSGWLMPFHGEYHWQNPSTPNGKCNVSGGSGSQVPCFYSSLGLAVSTDNGKTFQLAGQILQPSQPLSVFTGGGTNMAVGYGSLIVADANGKHLDNPPSNPNGAYFYLFFTDLFPGAPGVCATAICMGVARAAYGDVIAAALSGDPHKVATVFRKYDGASPDAWTQPATSDTPDLSGTAGRYAPLWTDEPGGAEVIYDSNFNVYLAVYGSSAGIKVRASNDLIHWSGPIGVPYSEAGRTLYYPTLIGETGDPTLGGPAPRVYFSSFPTGKFPDYTTAVFESVQLTLQYVPIISVSPTSNDYGIVKLKRSKSASFVIANSGKANLTLSTSINGPDPSMFAITSGGGSKTIKPGRSLTIKVTFKPASTGTKNAILEIDSNDPHAPTLAIPLSGTGQ